MQPGAGPSPCLRGPVACSSQLLSPAAEDSLFDSGAAHLEMLRHIRKDGGEGTDSEGRMARNGDVVLAAFEGGEAKVATSLPGDAVSADRELSGKIFPGYVAGKSHAAMTSSRTKWSRMTLGLSPSPK